MGCGVGQRRQAPRVLRGERRAAQRQARSSGGDALGRQTEAPVPACLSIFSRAPSPRAPLGLQEPPLRGPQPGPRLQVLLHQRVHLGPELAVGGRPAGLLPPELLRAPRPPAAAAAPGENKDRCREPAAAGRGAAGRPLSVSAESRPRDKTSSGGLSFLLKHYWGRRRLKGVSLLPPHLILRGPGSLD